MKQLPDAFCNLVFLSPEYNVERIIYDIHIPVLSHYDYLQKLNALWVEVARVLRDGGRLAINLPALVSVFEQNDHRAFNTPLFMDVMQEIEKLDVGLNLREALVWHKLSPIRQHHLSFPSPKNPCYRADHEYILIFSKKNWEMTPENEGAPHDLTADIYKEDCSSVISIAPQSKGVGDHPAVYPESLVEKIIRMHSFVGDTCVDPALGSGTTTAVAARMGRRWFGCDISPKYCIVAENRTAKAYKQFLKSIKDVDEAKNDKKKAA
jgi:site-specific DNA-methyltransferase (adenine-specific)